MLKRSWDLAIKQSNLEPKHTNFSKVQMSTNREYLGKKEMISEPTPEPEESVEITSRSLQPYLAVFNNSVSAKYQLQKLKDLRKNLPVLSVSHKQIAMPNLPSIKSIMQD